jgi:hypothetical protein
MSPPAPRRLTSLPLLFVAGLALAGCSSLGDFGRLQPSLVTDDMHAWVGQEAAANSGAPISLNPLTDEERTLRDLAFPLIEPPYDRAHWDAVLYEYGIKKKFRQELMIADVTAYYRHLAGGGWRSSSGRYNKLIDDIRADITRIGPFFEVAHRVADLDQRRAQSLNALPDLSPADRANALARVGENSLTMAWVYRSLTQRCAGYHFALDHMAAAEPEPLAAQAATALALLEQEIAANAPAQEPLVAGAPVAVAAQHTLVSK